MKITTQELKRDRNTDTRRDPITHLKIELAFVAQRTEGTKSAAQRLAANGIPLDIASRVLGTSKSRRRRP